MGIRIQPQEIDIPDNDPFANDLLDRKEKAEVLTSLVSNIDGPCTMAVDAAWGAGKTTFLKMWARYLRNQGFPVVQFNAWETDASGDPFVALTTEITNGLKEWPDGKVADRLHQTEFLARQVFRKLTPGAIRLAAGFIPLVGSEVGNTLGSLVGDAMAGYAQEQRSAAQYKSSLQALATTVWESSKGKPVVILIDELDRCRPTYAIELLETAKHIFGVDRVVFVLAVNRTELAHSVKALYGNEFSAEGYLRRFFDLDFRLPSPDRGKFIRNTLALNGVNEFLESSQDQFAYSQVALSTLITFLDQSGLKLRDISQALHRLTVVLLSLQKTEPVFFSTLTVLTVLGAVHSNIYSQFVNPSISADDAIESLFREPSFFERRRSSEGILVESVMIASRMSPKDFSPASVPEELKARCKLFSHYADVVERARSTTEPITEEWIHANNIYENVKMFHFPNISRSELLGFEETVQRFELLSPDLKQTAT